jgi:hypothetical protein
MLAITTRRWVLAVVVLGGMTVDAGAGRAEMITGLVFGGPGGTATLMVDPNDPTAAIYTANFTSLDFIVIGIDVSGPGVYNLVTNGIMQGVPNANVTNSTGVAWTDFEVTLTATPGATLGIAQRGFDGITDFTPNNAPTMATLNLGRTQAPIQPGDSIYLAPNADIVAGGAQRIDIRLSPTAVPEPSTVFGAGMAFLLGLAYAWRRRSPAASRSGVAAAESIR